MKKIIIGIIFGFLMINSVFADVLIPGEKEPDYNEGCITQCMKETGDGSPVCKYSCVRGHEEYTEEIITSIPMIPFYILFFTLFYFLLSKFFGKQITKNYQRALLFSVISIILAMSLIISLRLLYFYNNQPPDFSFSDNPHGRDSINIGRKNPI